MSLFSTPAREGDRSLLDLQNPAFISDLHLTLEKPDTVAGFIRFLNGPALEYRELVILGDFFNYWIGDDGASTVEPVTEALIRYTETGRRLFLMQGNRDFLMGRDYAKRAHATLIHDPAIARIGSLRLILSHGDRWCTNDPAYQRVRTRLRSRWWQWCALRLPLSKRLKMAENARRQSRAEKVTKPREITDVVDNSVLAEAHAFHASIVVHGHTHLPAVHDMKDGCRRFVLPDWEFQGPHCLRGGWLALKMNSLVLHGPEDFDRFA